MAKEKSEAGNAALDSLLNGGQSQVNESDEMGSDTEPDIDVNAGLPKSEDVVVAGKKIPASVNKSEDAQIVSDGPQQVETKVARKLKSYRITPSGKFSRGLIGEGVTIHNATDESHAKQMLYQARGVGHSPSKYPVKVSQVAATAA